MTVTEFHTAALAALASEPNPTILKELAKQAQQLADMVGWADGIIDKDGQVSTAFLQLQNQARTQYKANNDSNLATFHDELGNLLAAIVKHDEDLELSPDGNDDYEV